MFVFYGIPLVIVLLGGWLFILGVRPRRRGETPYCRKCGYNLTGRTLGDAAERCSECGAGLVAANIVHGERRRRPWRARLGVFVALLGATPLVLQATGTLAAIDWYKFKPTFWVKADAEGTNLGLANLGLAKRAFTELDRRYVADALSGDDRPWFIEYCLKEHALRPGRTGIQTGAVNVLWREHEAGRLSDKQSQKMFEAMVSCELCVLPRIQAGGSFNVELRASIRSPDAAQVRLKWSDLLIDNESVAPSSGNGTLGFPVKDLDGSWGGRFVRRVATAPAGGDGILTAVVPILIHRRNGALGNAVYSHERRTVARVTFSIDELRGPRALERSAELDESVRSSIELIPTVPRTIDPDARIELQIRTPRSIPAALSFDVIVEVDGKSRQPAHRYFRSSAMNTDSATHSHFYYLKSELLRSYTVRLRPNGTYSADVTHLPDFWPGELVFENVPGVGSTGSSVLPMHPRIVPSQPEGLAESSRGQSAAPPPDSAP